MPNEIDTLSELQPYNPGQPLQELQPIQPDSWGTLTNREIDEYQRPPTTQTLFGEPTQATPGQIDAMLGQLGGAFMHDFSSLGYPAYLVNAAISFVTANATKAPYQVQKNHNFNVHGEDDYLTHAFCNMVHKLSGSPRAKQQFVTACLQWLAKASKQLNSQQVTQAQGGAPHTSDPTENLTEAQYRELERHNNAVMAQTMATLQQRWGSCFKINIELAQAQLSKQTPAELAHLDRFTGSWPWTHMFNTVELLTAMYEMAIGANSIGASGASIAQEISQFEAMLKIPSERQKYMRDPAMQARLRELYARRGG